MTTVQEIRKNVNIEEEIETDLLFRQAKNLYPEVDNWVLKLAIEAHLNQLKQGEGVLPPYDRGVDKSPCYEQRQEAKMQEIN
jgi:hypothetical protein